MALSDYAWNPFKDYSTGKFLSSYGSWVGREGKIMEWLTQKTGFDAWPIMVVVMIVAAGLLVRDARKVKEEGAGILVFPIALLFVTGNFVVGQAMATIMLYAALGFLSFSIFWGFTHLSHKRIFLRLGLVVVISLLLFGNWMVGILMGAVATVIAASIKLMIRRKERGSAAERHALTQAGYQVKPEEKIISREHSVESQADRLGMLGEATEAAASAEERNVEMEIHAAALAAGVEEVSDAQKSMNQAGMTAEERNLKYLDYVRSIDEHIKNLDLENPDDASRASALKALGQRMVMALDGYIKDEEWAEKQKQHAEKVIAGASDVMIDASESAHSLAGLEIYAERETRVKVGNATKALTNRIEGMKRKMANLAAHAKNADPAVKKSIGRQIGKVEDEVSRLEASKNKIIDIRNKILDVLAKGRRVLHVVKEDAKKVEGLAKEVGAIENSMEKAEKHMDESIKRMREAHNSFQADIAAIDQGALPEEVLIKARGHATAIFEEIKKFIDMAIVIQQNDVLPMIQKNSQILQTSFRIEKADRFASRVQKFVNDSLEQLAIVLAAVGTPQEKAEAEKLKKVDEFQNDINRYAERKGKKIMAEVKKSYGDLGEAMKAAQTQLQYLNAQKGKVDAAEKETASALDSGLKELGEMRKKQAAQMEGALKQASNDLAKAQAAERREKRAA